MEEEDVSTTGEEGEEEDTGLVNPEEREKELDAKATGECIRRWGIALVVIAVGALIFAAYELAVAVDQRNALDDKELRIQENNAKIANLTQILKDLFNLTLTSF